jgi:hypothetical protein
VVVAAAVLVVAGACSTGDKTAASRYGGLPSWLPKSTVPVGRVVVASLSHPVLAIEGDTVTVDLPAGHLDVTAVGPTVPEEGQFPVPSTSPCTFTVTFSHGTGRVPFSPDEFTIVDERGGLHHPRVETAGSPASVGAQWLTVTITDVLPTGNGQLRWAPDGGAPVVSWDFDVEID